jgi:hypothetical protein
VATLSRQVDRVFLSLKSTTAPDLAGPKKLGENLMAGRSHSTFKKRQKELARVEKQRDKAEKRLQAGTKEKSGGPEIMSLEEAAALRFQDTPIEDNVIENA